MYVTLCLIESNYIYIGDKKSIISANMISGDWAENITEVLHDRLVLLESTLDLWQSDSVKKI